MDSALLVLLAAGTLIVRAGQMLVAMGSVRSKNAAAAGMRAIADFCVAIVCFWAIGGAIGSQDFNRVFAINPRYLIGWAGLPQAWPAQIAMVLISTGIVAPAVAERSRMLLALTGAALLAGIVVPVCSRWIGGGWLAEAGFRDAAGASALHLTGALCALTAAILVGPRQGKYNRDGSSNMIPGHYLTSVLAGTVLIVTGWIPYLAASASIEQRSAAAGNAFVSAAAAGMMSLIMARLRFGKADVLLTCAGVLGGLVSITAAGGSVSSPAAFIIGIVAGLIVPWTMIRMDLRWKIDDPAGFVAAHGGGAVWGLVSAAIFAPLPIGERARLLGWQIIGMLAVAGLTLALSAAVFSGLKATVGLRAKEADEFDGLDLAEHDINAYPDFQQTMIKSYHLREA